MLIKSATFTLAAIAFAVAGTTAVNAEAYTTRIEPRPFYGAVVTLEEGVRVIRPLPPERHVIINPGNATPLSLGFNETNVYENRTIRNYNYSEGGGSSSGTATYSGRAGFYGPGFATGGYGNGAGRQGGQGAAIGRAGRGHHGGHH
ncbi:MAG: hypothetical protein ABL897_02515 [Hyphomicrobium sp.]